MLSSISVSRVQPLVPPSPTLKHDCLLCNLGSVLTAFHSILTNLKPYSLAHINGFKLSLPHHISTYLTPRLNFLIKSPVSVSSWIQVSLLTFNVHVTALCKACNFYLRSLRHIRRSLTDDMGFSDCCCVGPITPWLLQLLIFQHVMFQHQQAPARLKSCQPRDFGSNHRFLPNSCNTRRCPYNYWCTI